MLEMDLLNSQYSEIEDRHSSRPFLVLFGISVALGGLLISQFFSPLYVFGSIALIASCIAVLVHWPQGGLLLILVASVMPRLSLGIGGWNARPEHYAVGLVVIVSAIRWLFGERPGLVLNRADYYVAAYILWNYASSFLTSPDPKMTLRWALLNNLVILPYFLIRFLVRDEGTLRWVFRAFLGVGIAECAYGIFCFVSRHLLGTSFGVEVGQYAAGFEGVYGTQFEPNLLGSCSASLAIVLLTFYFLSGKRSALLVGGIVIAITAMFVSLARAAFLSFVVVLILLAALGVVLKIVSIRKLLPLLACLFLFVPAIAFTSGRNLAERFASLSGNGLQDDGEAAVRLIAWTAALGDIWQHPILGNGTASFQLLAEARKVPMLGDRPWVGNSVVRILHDTGAAGLVLFGLVLIAVGKQVAKSIRNIVAGKEIVVALSAGCLVYAISFMATEATMLAFFWVHLGVLATAAIFIDNEGHATIMQRET
jgi:O-antigen ligase